VTYIDRKRLER